MASVRVVEWQAGVAVLANDNIWVRYSCVAAYKGREVAYDVPLRHAGGRQASSLVAFHANTNKSHSAHKHNDLTCFVNLTCTCWHTSAREHYHMNSTRISVVPLHNKRTTTLSLLLLPPACLVCSTAPVSLTLEPIICRSRHQHAPLHPRQDDLFRVHRLAHAGLQATLGLQTVAACCSATDHLPSRATFQLYSYCISLHPIAPLL
jgi:hypothetical protein